MSLMSNILVGAFGVAALVAVKATLGINKPLFVKLMSKPAEAFGTAPVVLIPMFWASACKTENEIIMSDKILVSRCFFIILAFLVV